MKAIVLVLIILTQYAKSITWLRGDGTLYASHCDFRNNDIGLARTNYWQCGAACRSFPGCTRFAWSLDNGGTCYFKSGSASISDAVEISNDNRGLICGILTFDEIRWEEESGFQWARMCDFKNNDLGVVRASDRNKCADSCRNFNGCTRFAWNLANGGSCYLKSGPRNVDDAILNNKDSGLICGIIKAANASTDDLGECQKVFCQSMLDRHNTYRTQHGVGNLKIDQTISTSAQEWSENLASLRQFFHSNGKYGENLAMFWSTNLAATVETCKDLGGRMTDLWYNEIDKYNFTNPGFSMETGHFTQVVWKSSQRIGCGISNNGSEFYGVAQYDPPGNFIGQFEQNVPKKIA